MGKFTDEQLEEWRKAHMAKVEMPTAAYKNRIVMTYYELDGKGYIRERYWTWTKSMDIRDLLEKAAEAMPLPEWQRSEEERLKYLVDNGIELRTSRSPEGFERGDKDKYVLTTQPSDKGSISSWYGKPGEPFGSLVDRMIEKYPNGYGKSF